MSHLDVLIAKERAAREAERTAGHGSVVSFHERRVDALVDLRDLLASGRWPSSIAKRKEQPVTGSE